MSFLPQPCDCPHHPNCDEDSITVCQGTTPWIVQGDEPITRDLDCTIDSVTICPPVSGSFEVEIIDQIGSCACHSDAVVTRVDASTSTVTLLSMFTDRKNVILWNDSTSTSYVKFGAGATTTDFTWKIASQSGYELTTPVYIGDITAVWDAATGAMQVTELV